MRLHKLIFGGWAVECGVHMQPHLGTGAEEKLQGNEKKRLVRNSAAIKKIRIAPPPPLSPPLPFLCMVYGRIPDMLTVS